MNVNIYIGDISSLYDSKVYDRLYRMVSSVRRAKIDRLSYLRDKCLSLGAECLLMCACEDFGIDYTKEEVMYDRYSKPCFAADMEFNLAHSKERAVCAAALCPVGCDAERINCANMRTAERFFAEAEYERLLACKTEEERDEVFYRLWTLKESFIKCTGTGMHLPLREFSVSLDPVRLTQSYDSARYRLFEYDCGDGYRYACCAMTDEPVRFSVEHIRYTDLL